MSLLMVPLLVLLYYLHLLWSFVGAAWYLQNKHIESDTPAPTQFTLELTG